MQSKKAPCPVPTDFNTDDYIGMESCVDLKDHHKAADMSPRKSFPNKMWGMGRKDQKEKEYPPPIPLLVRTENQGSHLPWVMKRHYTGDGRLILTEEKVREREFFRAHRGKGRLMLQLVAVEEGNVETGDEEDGGEAAVRRHVGCLAMGRDATLILGVAVSAGSLSRTVSR